jgi:MraZ protein
VVEPPRGSFQAKVDEKGRLKLPSIMQQYLAGLGESKVFITTTDIRTARIYPISVWKENEILFERPSENAEALADLAFIANHYGADSEIDGQGRVLVPTELRRELNMENQPVHLECFKGGINIYNKSEYDQKLEKSRQDLAAKKAAAAKEGFR